MSEIKVNCPHCKQPLEVPEEMMGTVAECPSCNGQIQLPARQSKMSTNVPQPQTRSPQSKQSVAHAPLQKAPIKPPFIQNSQQPKPATTMFVIVSALVVVVLCLVVAVVILLNRQGSAQNDSADKSGSLQASSLSSSLGQEAKAKQARLPGSVEGSAWLIKRGGDSDILRGLTISIINTEIDRQTIAIELDLFSKICLKTDDGFSKEIARMLADKTGPFSTEDDVAAYRRFKNSIQQCNSKIHTMENSATKIDTEQLYAVTSEIKAQSSIQCGDSCNATWLALVAGVAVRKGLTGIDGKFALPDLAAGDYILYAQASSSRYSVEWFLPISVKGGQATRVDLFNENAAHVGNKD